MATPLPTTLSPARHLGWPRRIEALALLATIPAFYLAMDTSHRVASAALYLGASLASAVVTALEWRQAAPGTAHPTRRVASHLGVPLAAGLLLCALFPQGDSPDLLLVRLGTAALTVLRWGESTLPSRWRSGLPQLLGLGIGVFGLCGLGFWWLEPQAHTFGDGLWLAFTTAATVGYGDIVPSSPAAKIFAVFVVLMGLAVLSLVTASIATFWVQAEERRIEHEVLRDLHRELRALRDQIAALKGDRP